MTQQKCIERSASSPVDADRVVLERYRRRFTRPHAADAYQQRFLTRKAGTHALERRALERVLSRLGQIDRLLDAPVGAGRLLGVLCRHARGQVVGLDVSAEMLSRARAEADRRAAGPGAPQVDLLQGDLLALPFAEGSFDVVVCIRFLHHLRSGRLRVEALRELARVSRRYLVVTFFDYLGTCGLRQGWKRLRGKKVKPSAVPLGRFQVEAARAGLRMVDSVATLPGLKNEYLLVLEKDPSAARDVEQAPEQVSTRLRWGGRLKRAAWVWLAAMATFILFCEWRELEEAEPLIWPPGILLMLLGGMLLAWSYRSRKVRRGNLERGPYGLMRHPWMVGSALWLCGFALTAELWWMGLLVWPAVLVGLWPAAEYAEALGWLRHGHAYDLYTERTPLFLPTGQALRGLWRRILGSLKGSALKSLRGFWQVAGCGASLVTSIGVALALLKEMVID